MILHNIHDLMVASFFENRIFMPILTSLNMRILQLHCDHIEYTPTKKEIQSAEDIENPQTQRL